MSLGENIHRRRTELGLSQDALAEKLGVARQSISKWERDSATPELEKLKAMAELFGVTLDSLVYGGGEEPETDAPGAAHTVIQEPGREHAVPVVRFAIGLVLFAVGLTATVLLPFIGGLDPITAAFMMSPLLCCGLTCMLVKRRVWFWILVSVYAPVLLFLEFMTAVSVRETLALLGGSGGINPTRAAVAAAMALADIGIGAAGATAYRSATIKRVWVGAAALLLLAAIFLLPTSVIVTWKSAYFFRIVYGIKHLLFAAIISCASVLVHSIADSKRAAEE